MKQTAKKVSIARGIRNCNPLNIEYSKANNWHGQLPYNKIIEPRFCRFSQVMWGYRAAAMIIRKYINVYGLNTITKLLNKWAPASENQTVMYIKSVSEYSHIGPDEIIDFNNMPAILGIMGGMTIVECGRAYDPQENGYYWSAMYKGYQMVRHNRFDGEYIHDPKD